MVTSARTTPSASSKLSSTIARTSTGRSLSPSSRPSRCGQCQRCEYLNSPPTFGSVGRMLVRQQFGVEMFQTRLHLRCFSGGEVIVAERRRKFDSAITLCEAHIVLIGNHNGATPTVLGDNDGLADCSVMIGSKIFEPCWKKWQNNSAAGSRCKRKNRTEY